MRKKLNLTCSLTRTNGDYVFELKIPKEIEAFYQKLTQNKKETSQKWHDTEGKPFRFYKWEDNSREDYQNYRFFLDDLNVSDDFGSAYLNDYGRINIAFLRCVGASEGIKVNLPADHISYESAKMLQEKLSTFSKKLIENFIKDFKLKLRITYEVI